MNTLETTQELKTGSNKQIVQSAIQVVLAYHEVQLSKYNAMLEGCNPPALDTLLNKYHQFLETNETNEEAFIAFLKHLSE